MSSHKLPSISSTHYELLKMLMERRGVKGETEILEELIMEATSSPVKTYGRFR
tara:strand:+ start:158 stop:316 length:159 start_codon:yes stop_codon:yes gene_type:complete